MRRVYILTRNYFDFDHSTARIGGVETYISELVGILHELQYQITIYAYDVQERVIKMPFGVIRGYNIPSCKQQSTLLSKKVASEMEDINDLVIINTDSNISRKVHFNRMISIQHGIAWDIPINRGASLLWQMITKLRGAYTIIKRINECSKIVCVDYNFPCWIRAITENTLRRYVVIPNFSHLAPVIKKTPNSVNIIFARRLVEYRGTKVFTEAILKVLEERDNINVTIAGTGPDEKWMRERLEKYANVTFTHYESSQSLAMHKDQHIAVVPTVGSEGTSLSLIEAMASQCAVVCTDVGGMTNVVIDDFNGKMVPAGDSEALYKAILELVDAPNEMERLANNAYETVKSSFSYENWKRKWIDVIQSV